MSTKRTSPEPSTVEQTNEDSYSVFKQDESEKGVKLSTLNDATLQDLPLELIECILIKAVAMEVNGMKLAKSVGKEKADLVISRLRTVCPLWNSILTTDFFRNELHRTLDRIAQKTIRMEFFHQSPLRRLVSKIATIKDELFLFCLPHGEDYYTIRVYDRNNMAEVKEVIPLPGICPQGFAACSISNCVYILSNKNSFFTSVLRVMRDDTQCKLNISPIISDLWMPNPNLSVNANGSLILLRRISSEPLPVVSMYNANGFLQHEIRLSSDISNFCELFPKSNGNFVLVSYNDKRRTKLTEIDTDGTILRQHQSSLCAFHAVGYADIYGRMLLTNHFSRIELLDSEFNRLDFTCSQLDDGNFIAPHQLHYNSERNEIVGIVDDALTIFHFTEE